MIADDARLSAKHDAQSKIDAASALLESGAIDEPEWSRRVTDALALAYLIDDDPRWQSGFDGDAALWRQARELVLDPIDHDGTFLDMGCANGHLMECLERWGRERGRALSMYGLELNPTLAATARLRRPEWAHRIFEGNVLDWHPPRRFDFARVGLEYVPADKRVHLVRRIVRDVLAPGGALIIGPVSADDVDAVTAVCVSAGFSRPAVHSAVDRDGKTRHVVSVTARTV